MIMDKNIKNTKDAFAKVFGSPGEAPIIIGLVKAFWPLLIICFLLGYIFRAIWIEPYLSQSQAGFILVVISILGFLFLFLGGRKLNNYLKGARGEEWVSNQLAFLDYNYSIFNGIKLENFMMVILNMEIYKIQVNMNHYLKVYAILKLKEHIMLVPKGEL